MPDNSLQKRLPLLETLLTPIQKIIRGLLPEFIERDLKNKAIRNQMVNVADAALVRQFPIARIFPPEVRRKVIRRQLDVVLDDFLLNEKLPTQDFGTSFRSFIVTANSSERAPAAVVETAIRRLLGSGWTATALPIDLFTFELTTEHPYLSVREAWDLAYRLQAEPGIAHVEPNLIVPLENLMPDEGPAVGAKSFFGKKPLRASASPEWSLDIIRVKQAWQHADTNGRSSRGEGVLIAHPDTGYTRHVENWSADPAQRRLLTQFGWDFWKNDTDATDDLESAFGSIFTAGFIGNPGHGTGTSSIIFSDEGPRQKSQYVTGVAPRARLIPYRVAPSVVVWDRARLADAIIRATDAGCHVISISMGGLPLDYLQRALQRAVGNGVIVCCAAGNIFGANDVLHGVVWPAHYPEAIAVAASNANDQPWSGSSRGPEVDITAPGESVWHAIAKKGKPLIEVARGDGTSFAVATTAGVAALWLAYHGRDKLIADYGKERIAAIFKNIVMTLGFRKVANWKTNLFGPGIIDALKVLEAPLPAPTHMPSKAAPPRQGKFDQIASLFDDVPRADLRRGLAELLNTSETLLPKRLDEVGDELLFHFYSDGKMRQELGAKFQAKAPKGKSAKAKRLTKELPRAGAPEALATMASSRLASHVIRSTTTNL
jgi:serine protease